MNYIDFVNVIKAYFLYYLIFMSNCFDLKFMRWGFRPNYRWPISKFFNYYVIGYAETGALELHRSGEVFFLQAPVVFLIHPGMEFRFWKQSESQEQWRHRFVGFYGPFAEQLEANGLLVKNSIIHIEDSASFTASFDELLNYLDFRTFGNDRAVHHLLDIILQLQEQSSKANFSRLDKRIKRLAEGISKNPLRDINFHSVAESMNVSYSHFRKLFTEGVGTPPTAYLLFHRLERAAWLLRNRPEMNLLEVANHCGYRDIYYFSKAFKQHHLISPGRYRKSHS